MRDMANKKISQERFLNERDVARELGIPSSTLRSMRFRDMGPRYFKLGRAVRYARVDLEDWLSQRVVVTGNLSGESRL